MKSEEDKWLDALKGKVDGYEESPGEALWRRIENDLPAPRRRRPMVVWLRVAATAACLILLLGVGTVLFRSGDEQPKRVGSPVIADASSSSITEPPVNRQSVPSALSETPNLLAVAGPATSKADSRQSLATSTSDCGITQTATSLGAPQEETYVPQQQQEQNAADTTENRRQSQRMLDEEFITPMNTDCTSGNTQPTTRKTTATKYADRSRWHVALAASNTMWGGESRTAAGFKPLQDRNAGLLSSSMLYESSDFARVYSTTLANTIDESTTTVDRIDFPVNVSLSVRYMLTSHWGVNVGISYSRSSSERRSGTSSNYYSQHQQMHFVGVPLSVSYTFFNSRYLTAYALAGGDVEKCVYAVKKEKTVASSLPDAATRNEALDVHPWQGTLFAGAGLQLNVTDRYGIFAEPQLAFDVSKKESTPVKRRDDLSFQLSVGLRMTY